MATFTLPTEAKARAAIAPLGDYTRHYGGLLIDDYRGFMGQRIDLEVFTRDLVDVFDWTTDIRVAAANSEVTCEQAAKELVRALVPKTHQAEVLGLLRW